VEQELKLDWKEFAEGAGHWLKLFDESFAMDAIPLHARPLKSAMWLVKVGISELPYGDSKEDEYFHKEWFAAIVVAIRKWYEDRYGAEAFTPAKSMLPGLVMLYSTPVKLEVLETISRVEVEGETSWLIWPDSIHETETVLSFLPTKPNLSALGSDERAKFEENVATIVKRTRSMNLALHSASDLPDEGKQMVPSIPRHIEKGVSDILSLKPSNAAVAIWELHLAVEKSFKIFLHQQNTNIKTHDLEVLSKRAKEFGLTVTDTVLKKLPSWKKSTDYRYAEEEVYIDYAVEIYDAALQLVDEITSKLRRDLIFNNAGFLIQKPKWVGRK
jgi:hypothetical protein